MKKKFRKVNKLWKSFLCKELKFNEEKFAYLIHDQASSHIIYKCIKPIKKFN